MIISTTMEGKAHDHSRNRIQTLEPLQRPPGRRNHVSPVRHGTDLYSVPENAAETGNEGRFSEGVTLAEGKLTPKQEAENAEKRLVLSYSWEALRGKSGLEQYGYYEDILRLFGKHCARRVREIYQGAATRSRATNSFKTRAVSR